MVVDEELTERRLGMLALQGQCQLQFLRLEPAKFDQQLPERGVDLARRSTPRIWSSVTNFSSMSTDDSVRDACTFEWMRVDSANCCDVSNPASTSKPATRTPTEGVAGRSVDPPARVVTAGGITMPVWRWGRGWPMGMRLTDLQSADPAELEGGGATPGASAGRDGGGA